MIDYKSLAKEFKKEIEDLKTNLKSNNYIMNHWEVRVSGWEAKYIDFDENKLMAEMEYIVFPELN